MMSFGEITKSGAFVAIVFVLVVLLVPFGLEQVGETTDFFEFPVTKTIKGWFSSRTPVLRTGGVDAAKVDWERYRRDLEDFSLWSDDRCVAVIAPPSLEMEVFQVREEKKPELKLWTVPVASCTPAVFAGRAKGYVFISGFNGLFEEGGMIQPSESRCGYEILSVGERTVWFRAVFAREGDVPMGVAKFPEFTRTEGDSLVRGNRRYFPRDAFKLGSGGWLMIDSFIPPDGVVFKILNEHRIEVATILCVVIGAKGGG